MSRLISNIDSSVWKTRLEPFTVTFTAIDDNNQRISGKQLYLKYAKTYDRSVPDLTDAEHIYSDMDGNLQIYFNEPCNVSLEVYLVKEFSPYLKEINEEAAPDQYICKVVADNIFLPFQPFIEEFTARYTDNNPIRVDGIIPRKYIELTIKKSDSSVNKFTLEDPLYDAYIVSPNTVSVINNNTIKVSYYDSLLDKTWEYDIIIVGKEKAESLSASYPSQESKRLFNFVTKSEILVELTLYDGYNHYTRILDESEWQFNSTPQITNLNDGKFKISYSTGDYDNDGNFIVLEAEVIIPYTGISKNYKLDAWYEGLPVIVGEKFDPNQLIIYLYNRYKNNDDEGQLERFLRDANGKNDGGLRSDVTQITLQNAYCTLIPSDRTVTKEGFNWFTIKYVTHQEEIQDKFIVIGYIPKEYPEHDFQMFYLDPEIRTYTDVTEDFAETCSIAGRTYFNWEKILDHIVDIKKYGIYKLCAPRLCGLSNRCDSEWNIYCFNRKAIKAKLVKYYIEEEEKEDFKDG